MPRVGCIVFSGIPHELPQEFCELFLRFTPVIACRRKPPHALFLDFRGIETESPSFEGIFPLKVQALMQRGQRETSSHRNSAPKNSEFRIGFGENAGFALMHALHPQRLETPLSVSLLEEILDPFGVTSETRKAGRNPIASWMKLLHHLGIRTLRDFSLLPPVALASRFGKTGLEFSRRLREGEPTAWPVFVPQEKLIEIRDFSTDQPLPASLEPILFASKELLDRISARLCARMLRASAMQLVLQHEGQSRINGDSRFGETLIIRFCTPQGSTSGMLPSFRERVTNWLRRTETEEVALYGREILSLSIEVLETAPGHRPQRDFFHSHDAQAECWDSLLSRLSEKIGPEARFQAQPVERHLPEKSWSPREPRFTETVPASHLRQNFCPEPQLELLVTRPTRLLRDPILLEHQSGILRWPDTEKRPGQKKRVLKWIGPERICEGWWEENLHENESQRDYFRVLCHGGIQLWGYFEREQTITPQAESRANTEASPLHFHLQGYFD